MKVYYCANGAVHWMGRVYFILVTYNCHIVSINVSYTHIVCLCLCNCPFTELVPTCQHSLGMSVEEGPNQARKKSHYVAMVTQNLNKNGFTNAESLIYSPLNFARFFHWNKKKKYKLFSFFLENFFVGVGPFFDWGIPKSRVVPHGTRFQFVGVCWLLGKLNGRIHKLAPVKAIMDFGYSEIGVFLLQFIPNTTISIKI